MVNNKAMLAMKPSDLIAIKNFVAMTLQTVLKARRPSVMTIMSPNHVFSWMK